MTESRCICGLEFQDSAQFREHLAGCDDAMHEGHSRWLRHQAATVRPPTERCKLNDQAPPGGTGSGWGTGCLWWADHQGDCKIGAVPEDRLNPTPATEGSKT